MFKYVFHVSSEELQTQLDNPGEELITLNPKDGVIVDKVVRFIQQNKLSVLFDKVMPRSLFGIESTFVEENPKAVREYNAGDIINYPKEIKLFTNDKSGPAGRSKWFVTERKNITVNAEYIDEWQVAVSSAHPGGQEGRDNQIEVIDNHSAFGRARVGLSSFKTEKEALNFYKYAESTLIKFMFLMTDENLSSLGKKVPDIGNYTDQNKFVDFNKDVNSQLYKLVGLTDEEILYVENKIALIRKG